MTKIEIVADYDENEITFDEILEALEKLGFKTIVTKINKFCIEENRK